MRLFLIVGLSHQAQVDTVEGRPLGEPHRGIEPEALRFRKNL